MDDERTFYPTNNSLAMGCFFSLPLLGLLGAAIFFLSGCGAVRVDKAPTTEESEVVAQPAMTYTVELPKKMTIYVDPDTNCEYILYKGYLETSITPRMYMDTFNQYRQKGCVQ